MKFGAALKQQAYPLWRDRYIDYDCLKALINEEAVAAASRSDSDNGLQQRVAFQRALDEQLQTLISFYKAKELELKDQAAEALQRDHLATADDDGNAATNELPAKKAADLDHAVAAASHVAENIGHLLDFVSVNMIAIRKILKKYAKKNLKLLPPVHGCLALEIEHPHHEHATLHQGSFLPASVAKDLEAMQQHTQLLDTVDALRAWLIEARQSRHDMLVNLSASQRLPSISDRLLSILSEDVRELQHAAEDAALNASFVHPVPYIERAAGLFEPPPPAAFAVATTTGIVLNNVSTLLYMANYTAVLPPTAALCDHLNVPPTLAGVIVGASDAAAIFASIGVSIWTQYSFKQPLVFSAMACIVGNVIFVLSYMLRSLPLLILSRLLNGLGSARTANRRYVADYVSKQRRTMASAAFVGSSNFGQALGPLLSVPLVLLPKDLKIASLPINPVTAVGFSMGILWILYVIAALLYFEEPPKWTPIGLARGTSLVSSPAISPRSATSEHWKTVSRRHHQRSSLERPLLRQSAIQEDQTEDEEDDEEQPRFGIDNEPHSQAQQLVDTATAVTTNCRAEWLPTLAPTFTCVSCLFVQKMVQQAYMDGVPLLTDSLADWNSSEISLFLGFIGLLGVPCNLIVGVISSHVSDRTLVLSSGLITTVSLFALIQTVASIHIYFIAGIVLFIATVVLEGTATSLMSKVIWNGFARGVFNAGLLSTESGTFGRFTGNAVLTWVGHQTGVSDFDELSKFVHWLHAVLAVACVGLIAQLLATYRRLRG